MNPTRRRACAIASIAAWASATLFAVDAVAHTRSVSHSTWQINGNRARVTLRLDLLEITRLSPNVGRAPVLDAELSAYWVEHLQLRAGGERCPPSSAPRSLASSAGKAAFEWQLDCGQRPPDEIRTSLFFDVAPGHLHFARLQDAESATVERVLSLTEPGWSIGADAAESAVGSSFGAYVALGVEHIATGADHLVFVLALLLLATRLREVATIVTGFTVAHSITLSLAVLGGLRPEAHAVEALIGLSIALVAAENAWLQSGRPRGLPVAVAALLLVMAGLAGSGLGSLPAVIPLGLAGFSVCYFAIVERVEQPVRLRIAIAFVFGLVHGFGFAGVLEDISLADDRLASALFGFNLGVELGQLVVVAAVWPALRALARARDGRWHRHFVEGATAVVCALGVFWLVSRAYAIS
jgi:hypothetical protein